MISEADLFVTHYCTAESGAMRSERACERALSLSSRTTARVGTRLKSHFPILCEFLAFVSLVSLYMALVHETSGPHSDQKTPADDPKGNRTEAPP